jgi:hypothetical protein
MFRGFEGRAKFHSLILAPDKEFCILLRARSGSALYGLARKPNRSHISLPPSCGSLAPAYDIYQEQRQVVHNIETI